jgi:hypothetical protein
MTQSERAARLAPWLETAWLQRYLERQLDADETAWFEAYLIDKPLLLDRVERDTDLRDALAGQFAVPVAAERLAAAQDDRRHGTVTEAIPALPQRGSPRSRRRLSSLALAASLVGAVGVGWFAQSLLSPPATSTLIASPMRVIYDTERGAPTPPRIEHADSTSPYALIEVAVPPGAEQVVLRMPDAPPQSLAPSSEGFVSFLVERSLINAGPPAELAYRIGSVQASKSLALATDIAAAHRSR